MVEQTSLWKSEQQSSDFAELSNALYERELHALANMNNVSVKFVQGRLKSLPYYIKRTADVMIQCKTPLILDIQNASWSAKQAIRMPLMGQDIVEINQWYRQVNLKHGLVLPIVHDSYIALDCIDRINEQQHKFRTNVHGWFSYSSETSENNNPYKLLKPNKRVMTAACSGHCWVNNHKSIPVMPTLRELLLSCTINWRNFKQPNSL